MWDFCRHGFAEYYCVSQEFQGDYDRCKTIAEAITQCIQILERERAIGLKLEPEDTNYFVDHLEDAKLLKQLWDDSQHDTGDFLELIVLQSSEVLEELAHILVSGDFNELCF